MTNPLTSWIDAPAVHRGISFWRNNRWEWWTYADLAGFARRIAGGIRESGVQRNDRVLIVEHTGPEFVAALFGTMFAGAVPCPVAPPQLFQNESLYARHLSAISEAARSAMVITAADLVDRFGSDADQTPARTPAALATSGEYAGDTPASAALLQFTSGSSGRVKGVRVPVHALAANVAAIGEWLEMAEGDVTASWLPVHHDMGLIGCLLTPVVHQRDLWLQDPAAFVRDPARYLACFNAPGAAMTAMPPFGLEYIVRRIPPDLLAGSDFSGWRALIVGAERIDLTMLERFMELMGPFGFDRRALLPAYGLAEATLAVTGLALREEFTTARVAPYVMSLGAPVTSTGAEVQHVVGCGRAMDGIAVGVFDEADRPLPDRHVGQIAVHGTSVAEGYVHDDDSVGHTEWRDGMLWTGDAGFIDDGQLFVIGRIGDAMKVRGRTVFAEDIENALVGAGVPRLRVAVLLGSSARGATSVILLERPDEEWIAATAGTARRMTEGISVTVLDVARRSILRTTSGKPKRRDMWTAYIAGDIDGTEIDDSAGATAPLSDVPDQPPLLARPEPPGSER